MRFYALPLFSQRLVTQRMRCADDMLSGSDAAAMRLFTAVAP